MLTVTYSCQQKEEGTLLIWSSLVSLRFGTVPPSAGFDGAFSLLSKWFWPKVHRDYLSQVHYISGFPICSSSSAILALTMAKPCRGIPGSLPSKHLSCLASHMGKPCRGNCALDTWMLSFYPFLVLRKIFLVSSFEHFPPDSLGNLRRLSNPSPRLIFQIDQTLTGLYLASPF